MLYLGKSTVGKSHDYGMLKDELSPSLKLFQSCKTYVDLGYLGIDKDYQGEFIIRNYSGTQLIDITCDFFEDFVIPEFL